MLESGTRKRSTTLEAEATAPPMTTTPRDAGEPAAPPLTAIDGEALAAMLTGAAEALRRQSDAINAINVFPVPDGDTGTNMSLTMRAAAEDAVAATDRTASGVAAAAAKGALMGAKGNSGVILSQILGGLARTPEPLAAFGADALAGGFARARDAAYAVVGSPREGTILTAIAAAADAAARHDGDDVIAMLDAVAVATADAVARTPDLLPVLKEAGVVDSGAQGLYVALDGMLRALRGDAPSELRDLGAIDPAWLSATSRVHDSGEQSGFCTEFVIEGEALDAATVRAQLSAFGDSLLVVGGGDVLRVHLHTHAPDDAIGSVRALGAVSHEKIDNMETQFRALARSGGAPANGGTGHVAEGVAVVAIGAGEGIIALFESMGAAVVPGGQTMNPSAGEIREAIEATGAAGVIVLPNNKNIIMAAKLASQESAAAHVEVIEARSVPQGVAALVAYNSEATLEENAEAMREAIEAVRTGEITLAARETTIHGIAISEGQPIALIDGDIALAADTVADAVRECVGRMLAGRVGAIVTLYAGDGVEAAAADEAAAVIREMSGAEVEVVAGGQPHYPYLVGVE